MPSKSRNTRGKPVGKTKKGHRNHKGGSASTWITDNFGDMGTQFKNTFGPDPMFRNGALIPTVAGAPAVLQDNVPQGSHANYQKGGKRRKRIKKSKKGGYWAAVMQQALVPFGLLGLQHTYARRKGRANNSTRKNRG
jgi:hypothetical protein